MPESTSLAPLSVLERVCLEVEYLARGERVRRLRQRVSLLECEQHELRGLIEERLGTLQRDLEELRNEVQLLESRLRRLLRVAQPLTDEELDAAARREEPRVTDGDREAHRHHGSGRDNGRIESMVEKNGHEATTLRRLYRTLARLLHPDLARDQHDRVEREHLMRLVNQAWERRDAEQLQRLVALWSVGEESLHSSDLDQLRRGLARREVEELQLVRRLRELERSDLTQLARRGPAHVERYLLRQEEMLRHEMAVLRLRRRRLLRLIEERRRELALRASSQR